MKAAILNGYNKNGCDLEIKDIPVPEISANEVRVKIKTAGVNPLEKRRKPCDTPRSAEWRVCS